MAQSEVYLDEQLRSNPLFRFSADDGDEDMQRDGDEVMQRVGDEQGFCYGVVGWLLGVFISFLSQKIQNQVFY